MRGFELRTRRLHLRPWRDADLEPMTAVNRDPEVRELLRAPA